ncbi:MAG: cell wall-associated NlpC family hydrolase [Flammeovirgaceae bacterium]|jgi:cell wall-associated NlpC family hydrolase
MKKLLDFLLSIFSGNKEKNAPAKENNPSKPKNTQKPSKKTIPKVKEEKVVAEKIEEKPVENIVKSPVPKETGFPIAQLLAYADKQLGTPYLIGGTTPDAFDCSGFVDYVFEKFDIDLPRTSSMQSETGQDIDLAKTRKGDLVFFSHTGDRIQHVGIITSDEGKPLSMIHASSSKERGINKCVFCRSLFLRLV